MLKKYKAFSLCFLAIFLLELAAEYFGRSVAFTFSTTSAMVVLMRPCVVLSLMMFFVWTTKLKGRFHKRLFTGLIFAWIGDLLFMLNPSYFLYALLSFLISNLFYTRAFYLDFLSAQELDKKIARIAIACCSIGAIAFYFFLRPYLGGMKLPIMVYVFVVSMMLMMSVFRRLRVNTLSFNLIFVGALIFALSDGLLAYFKFIAPSNLSGLMIMSTYMIAQFLIVMGGAERKLLSQEP